MAHARSSSGSRSGGCRQRRAVAVLRRGQPRLDHVRAVGQLVDDHVGLAQGVELQVARRDGHAVGHDLQSPRHDGIGVVGHAHEQRPLQPARVGAHGQRGDGLVGTLPADRDDPDRSPDVDIGCGAAGVVGDHQDLRIACAGGQRAGQLERVGQVGRGGRRPDGGDGARRAAGVGGLVGDHARRVGRGDDADPRARRQVAQRADGSCLGSRQPVGKDVRGGHAGRGIHDHHEVMRKAGRPVEHGPRHDGHQQDGQQQLHQQQQRAPQPLPGRVGLHVANQLLPQEGAAHRPLVAAQPEHVEGHDERHAQQAQQPQRRQQAHATTRGRRQDRAPAPRPARLTPRPGGGAARRRRGRPAAAWSAPAGRPRRACGSARRGAPAMPPGVRGTHPATRDRR